VLAASRCLPAPERDRVAALIAEMRAQDGLDLEARYVEQFDRGRSTSLNLFEHVHGESRDRGTAMVELKQIYERAGYDLASSELPDYLPVVLEYLSCRDLAEARAMLGDCAHILRAIGEALAQRGSPYAAVFAALLALVGERGLDARQPVEASRPEPAIDDDWAEAPAFAPPRAGGAPDVAPVHFVPRKADRSA
jgi:nitrate reductase delta subunit